MVFYRSIVNWSGGVDVFSVYLHSAICETYLVSWYSIDLLSIGVWGVVVSSVYMHLQYVKLMWCNSTP